MPLLIAIWSFRSYAPWVLFGLAALAALWFRAEAASCRASIATEAAKAEAMVNAAKAADADLRRHLEEQLAPVTRALQDQANATQIALAKVPSNPGCAHTPAANAFDGSVRPSQQAGPNATRPTRP